MTRRPLTALTAMVALLLAVTAAAHAQDIEARAAAMGRPLPAGYFERIARDPRFFQIKRGWLARTRDRFAPTIPGVARANLGVRPLTGTIRLAVIPALYADSPTPDVSAAQIQTDWFDGPNAFGTLTQYYSEISRGVFTINGATTDWVRTSLTVAQVVGTSQGLGVDARTGEYLTEAIHLADASIDFGQYDNDGPDGIPNSGDDDGYVDAVAFEEIEVPSSCGGPAVWPHRSAISGWTGTPVVTDDTAPNGAHIRVDDYILLGVHDCAGAGLTSSVISHEMGHILGLPDMYDAALGIQPAQRRWVLGCWSLMAGGSWGCGDGSLRSTTNRPTHDSPWEKQVLGWLNVTLVGTVAESTFVLPPIEESGAALRVQLTPSEYLLIEYRKQESFDTDLPASGVIVYHVDEAGAFSICATCSNSYYVGLVEADGNSSLTKTAAEGGDRGTAGDAFARLVRTDSLSGATVPALHLNSGVATPVSIDAMRLDANGNAYITLSTAVRPVVTLPPTAPPYVAMDSVDVAMRIAGGVQPYAWSLYLSTLPAGVSLVSTGHTARLVGRALESGTFRIRIQAADATAYGVIGDVTLNISAVVLARDRVLQPFTGSSATPLTDLEKQYLDAQGNHNGRYDVGDLRAWLAKP